MKTTSFGFLGAGFAALTLACSQPAGAESDLSKDVEAYYDAHLEELFVHFHENPELSHREFETAARIAEELRALGIEVTEGVGGTGLVGVVDNGSGPTILIRADMDGLPVQEKSGLSYASQATQEDIDGVVKPVMHACGHDVHITALVGTAKQLMDRRDEWSGTILFVAQPAEERITGAKAMIEDGLYDRFPKPEAALAFHVAAQMELGKLRALPGLMYSSSDSVDITVRGVGSHGASPHKGVDPVLVGSQIVVSLQSLVSRTISPLQPGVVTVGSFHSGFKHNIITDEAKLQLTVRSNDPEVRAQLLDGIDRVAEGVARSLGVPDDLLPIVERLEESTPPTFNDPELTARLNAALKGHFGEARFDNRPRTGMGAEDFAYFVQPDTGVKGYYFQVGGTPAGEVESAPAHHSPLFKITPEPAVRTGVEAMTLAALELLGN